MSQISSIFRYTCGIFLCITGLFGTFISPLLLFKYAYIMNDSIDDKLNYNLITTLIMITGLIISSIGCVILRKIQERYQQPNENNYLLDDTLSNDVISQTYDRLFDNNLHTNYYR